MMNLSWKSPGLTVIFLLAATSFAVERPAEDHISITSKQGPIADLEVLLPFYEGLDLKPAGKALADAKLEQCELAYPGALSAPVVAYRFGDRAWTVVYCDELNALPVAVDLKSSEEGLEITFKRFAGGVIRHVQVEGEWRAVAAWLRKQWNPPGRQEPLAHRFDQIRSYVQQFVAEKGDPPIQVNWTPAQLAEQMRHEPARALQFVYGFDPGAVDLGGEYFWSESARANVARVIGSNPGLSHLAWLNLRTLKTEIKRLNLKNDPTAQLLAARRSFPAGLNGPDGQWSFKSIDMCLASEPWQASRLKQFDRLADAGFKVIQLDEFPIPSFWHIAPCQSDRHLHLPADAASEWKADLEFVGKLSDRARKRNILLTCEEPSAALLPYVSGYIDRQYNAASASIYGPWAASAEVKQIPLFSAIFGDLATPYTDFDDAEPARRPPAGWLVNHKCWPDASADPPGRK